MERLIERITLIKILLTEQESQELVQELDKFLRSTRNDRSVTDRMGQLCKLLDEQM